MKLFLFTFATLFSVINPFGTVPVLVSLTQDAIAQDKIKVALRASIYTLLILLISFILGKYILQFFGVSIESLRIAGGIIISSSGFAMLTGKLNKHKGMSKNVKLDIMTRKEISLTPIAIPMLAGPGSISLLISLNQQYGFGTNFYLMIAAVVLVCVLTFVILSLSHVIDKLLGASGLNAATRLIGFMLIAIGVESVTLALKSLIESLR